MPVHFHIPDLSGDIFPCLFHVFSSLLSNSFHISLFSEALPSAGTCKFSNLLSIASVANHIPSNETILTKSIGCKQQSLGNRTIGCLRGGSHELPCAGPIHFHPGLTCCEQHPALRSLSQLGALVPVSSVVKEGAAAGRDWRYGQRNKGTRRHTEETLKATFREMEGTYEKK